MLTFHEFKNGMSVMDGKRCLAQGKPTPHGWILTLHGASWIDPRARTQGLIPGKYPNLMLVKTRREAAQVLSGLAAAGRPAP
jgi:hypothetical protein